MRCQSCALNKKGWKSLLLTAVVIGLIGVLILYMGLGQIFPGEEDLVSYVLRYLRYGLIGFWISGIGPRLFIRMKLAKAESE